MRHWNRSKCPFCRLLDIVFSVVTGYASYNHMLSYGGCSVRQALPFRMTRFPVRHYGLASYAISTGHQDLNQEPTPFNSGVLPLQHLWLTESLNLRIFTTWTVSTLSHQASVSRRFQKKGHFISFELIVCDACSDPWSSVMILKNHCI